MREGDVVGQLAEEGARNGVSDSTNYRARMTLGLRRHGPLPYPKANASTTYRLPQRVRETGRPEAMTRPVSTIQTCMTTKESGLPSRPRVVLARYRPCV